MIDLSRIPTEQVEQMLSSYRDVLYVARNGDRLAPAQVQGYEDMVGRCRDEILRRGSEQAEV